MPCLVDKQLEHIQLLVTKFFLYDVVIDLFLHIVILEDVLGRFENCFKEKPSLIEDWV